MNWKVRTTYLLGKLFEMFKIQYEWDFVKQLKPMGYTTVRYRGSLFVCAILVSKGRQE